MTLTHEHVNQLTALFPASAHEFLQGMTYLTEHAITARIEIVDPAWALKIYDVRQRDKTITVVVQLTICSVCRDGVGMAVIQHDKSGLREVNEAEKSAATDALKRAARLFGIGRYLLDLPDSVKDMRTLAEYLKTHSKTDTRPATTPDTHKDRSPQPTPPSPANGAKTGKFNWKEAIWWKRAVDALFNEFGIEREHGANLLNKWAKAGDLAQDMTEEQALDAAWKLASRVVQIS